MQRRYRAFSAADKPRPGLGRVGASGKGCASHRPRSGRMAVTLVLSEHAHALLVGRGRPSRRVGSICGYTFGRFGTGFRVGYPVLNSIYRQVGEASDVPGQQDQSSPCARQ